MDVNILIAESKDASEINYILKSAFRESFEKYRFCPVYEAEDSQITEWINSFIYDPEMAGEFIWHSSLYLCFLNWALN